MSEYKGLTVEFRGDATSLSAALAAIQRDASAAQSQLTGIDKALKNSSTNGKNLNNALKENRLAALGRDAQAAKERLTALKNVTPQLEANVKKATDKFKAMGTQEEYVANVTKKNTAAIAENNEKIAQAQQRMEGLKKRSSAYRSTAKEVEQLKDANKRLNDEIEAAAPHWNNMRQNMFDAQRALDKHNTSVLTAESNYKALSAEFDSAQRIAGAADTRFVKLGDSLINSGIGLQAVGKSISDFGDKLSLVSIAAAATFGRGIISNAEDFGNKISQVGVYLDTNAQGLAEMKDLAMQTGKETIFSAGEAAQAISELAKGGLTQAQIKAGALTSTMSLAAAGQLGLADAANVTVQAMKSFGIGAERSGEVADALAGVAAKSTAEVTDLSQGFVQVAAMAHNAGWSLQETSAAIGLMADRGYTGAMAGTALKVMLQRLTAPTDKARALMEELGIQVRDSNGHMKSAADVIDELNNAFYTFDENGNKIPKYSDDVRDAALSTMFGTRAINAALALMEGGSEAFEQYTAAASNAGSATKMAQGQLGELGWSFELLRGEAETAAVNVGEKLTPTIKGIADAAQGALEWFDNLDDGSQSLISHLGLMALAAGPVMSIGGRALTGLGKLGTSTGRFIKMLGQMKESLATAPSAVHALGDAISAVDGIKFSGAGGGLEKATALIGGLKGMLAGAGIAAALGLVAYAIGGIAEENAKAAEAAKRHEDATKGLVSAANGAQSAFKDEAGNIKQHASALDEAKDSLKSYEESMQSTAEAIRKNNDAAQQQVYTLNDALQTIEKYNGRQDLTTEQYGAFAAAVKTLNGVLGENFQITDGVITKTDDEGNAAAVAAEKIRDLVNAKKEQARLDSLMASEQELENQKAGQVDTIMKTEAAYKTAKNSLRGYTDELKQYGFTLDDVLDNPMDAYHAANLKNGSGELQQSLLDLAKAKETLDKAYEDSHALDKAKADIDYQVAALNKLTDAELRATMSTGELAASNSEFMQYINGAGKSISEFGNALDQSGVSVEQWNGFLDQFGDVGMKGVVEAFDGSAGSIKNAIASISGDLSAGTDSWKSSMESFAQKAGVSAEQFVRFLSDGIKNGKLEAGTSAEELFDYVQSKISDVSSSGKIQASGEQISEAFARGIEDGSIHAGMSVDELVAVVQEKLGSVDGTTVDINAAGNVPDGSAKENVDGTQESVNAMQGNSMDVAANGNVPDGSAKAATDENQASVDAMQGNSIDVAANGNVPDGSAKTATDETQGSISALANRDVDVNVHGNVLEGIAGTIMGVADAIGRLVSKTVNVGVNFFTNGSAPNKAGGIRWHAAGAIVNVPHTGYPLDMVGEAGAEAIVPLTNRRYAQPFIDMIGDDVASKLRIGGGNVTNIYFNGNRINDDPQIREVTKDYMMQLKRLGAM